jgi:hypothetical protein
VRFTKSTTDPKGTRAGPTEFVSPAAVRRLAADGRRAMGTSERETTARETTALRH